MNLSIYILFSVDLQQTSPFPVCPGDNVTFTCTVNSSAGTTSLLIWSNPKDPEQQVTYTSNDAKNKTEDFGDFIVKLTEVDGVNLVSTATLTADISHDNGHKEISCGYATKIANGKIELSGKLCQST